MTVDGRYSRQELLFGQEGQRRIQALRVAVVGMGGLGSHVAQQLAYLGVVGYVLVDGDVATSSSLNRLIGAVEADVAVKRPKVQVAERVIRAMQPTASVQSIVGWLESEQASQAIPPADVVFGCLDDDLSRLRLTDLCASGGRPYLDLASDTGEDNGRPWYGGRVVFSFVGQGCLSCRGLLDQRTMARASMTPEQRAEDGRIYGLPEAALGEAGPSVVSVNGVVASLAVTEFMVWATRLREPWPYLTYRGDLGRVTLSEDEPDANCFYCAGPHRARHQALE